MAAEQFMGLQVIHHDFKRERASCSSEDGETGRHQRCESGGWRNSMYAAPRPARRLKLALRRGIWSRLMRVMQEELGPFWVHTYNSMLETSMS